MSGLELIVRPFTDGSTSRFVAIPPATPTANAANVRLRVGRSGGAKTFHGSFSHSETKYVVHVPFEVALANIGVF